MAEEVFGDLFGTASVGGEYQRAVKIPKGVTEARLIPPIKSQKATGRWHLYHRVHYGYKGKNKRDSTGEAWARTFLCIEERDFKNNMTTRECPKCEQLKEWKAELEAREAEIKAEYKNEPSAAKKAAQIKAALKADPSYQQQMKRLKDHNVDAHFYINVKYAAGEIGCMKIPGKCKKALEEEIKSLRAKKVDPFAPGAGVFFTFNRAGEDLNTVYTVTTTREAVGTDGTERIKTAPLTAADGEAIRARGMDLATAHGATALTEKQIRQLLECDEDPETVDAIFDQATPAQKTEKASAPAQDARKAEPAAQAAKAAAPSEEDAEEAALAAQMAALKAKKAAKAAAQPAAEVKKAPPAAGGEAEFEENFLKEFGDANA